MKRILQNKSLKKHLLATMIVSSLGFSSISKAEVKGKMTLIYQLKLMIVVFTEN
jgi:hypothetical protein